MTETNVASRFAGVKKLILIPLVVVLIIAPVFLDSFLLLIFTLTFIFVLLGQSWNILGGYTGQYSLGHTAYVGIGAYTAVILYSHYDVTPKFGLSPWLVLPISGLTAMAASLIIGYPAFRLRGPYFLLATLAFAEVAKVMFLNFGFITGGALGLQVRAIPEISLGEVSLDFFRSRVPFYYIGLGLASFAVYMVHRLSNSKFGLNLRAVRDDEDVAESLGINTSRMKLYALLLSSFLAGLGGWFWTYYFLYINPYLVFSIDISMRMLLVPLLGGGGTVFGPVIGAIILIPVSEALRQIFGGGSLLVFGGLLVVIMLFMRGGILGKLGSKGGLQLGKFLGSKKRH